jgi:hypothetical protein
MPARTLASGLHARLPGKNNHQILSDLKKGLGQGAFETVAIGQQHHQGGNAPHDAEHGQRRAEPIMLQRTEGLIEDVENHS